MQIVTLRVEAIGVVRKAEFRPLPESGSDPRPALSGERRAWLPESSGWVGCPLYDRQRLAAGNRIAGPAIVEQMDATTLILPGMTARVDPFLNLVLEVG